jgi:hypothetical protein
MSTIFGGIRLSLDENGHVLFCIFFHRVLAFMATVLHHSLIIRKGIGQEVN